MIDPGEQAVISPCGNGHIVKLMGDGMLIEFNSVADAVAYAVSVQLEMRKRNQLASADKAVNFRIGINIRDVIVEDGDIWRWRERCRPAGGAR